jgi:hypothetical protein
MRSHTHTKCLFVVVASDMLVEDLHIDDPELKDRYVNMVKSDMRENAKKEAMEALRKDESFLAAAVAAEDEATSKAAKKNKNKNKKGAEDKTRTGQRQDEQVSIETC